MYGGLHGGLYGGLRVAGCGLLALLVACASSRPGGVPLAPLTATSPEEAMEQLRVRRETFRETRSLMHVRATTNGKTESFRARLVVHDPRRMELVAYTPVGTTALTLRAVGERVHVKNYLENTEWDGSVDRLPEPFKFLAGGLHPAEMAMVVLGFPLPFDRSDLGMDDEVTPAGLKAVMIGDMNFSFDPPAFPAKHVVITRGEDRVEIEHLEVVR